MSRILYRYGASFFDRASGLRFEAHHPAARPDRWTSYIEGAVREYARYGVGNLVDRDALERGDGVTVFFVGIDRDDRVVAGMRCHGPLDGVDAAQALTEMASSPEIGDHRAAVGRATPYGVIEIKGAWREQSGDGNHHVIAALARCCVHALVWFGAELMLTAIADRMEPLISAIGGHMMGTEAARYPSDRYRTILMAVRRARYEDLLVPSQARLLREDAEQLRRPPLPRATGWRPVVLDESRRTDRHILATLRADPAVEMVDVAQRQLGELAQLLPTPDSALLDEPLRDVYFPWRRAVVRMLGPHAYDVVRLDRNRNRITTGEQDRLRRQRVGVVGLSAGHAAAATIALEGLCGELRLADFDEVELTNLNRLPASVLDIGANKAVVAARRVAEIDPYLPVQIVPEGLTYDNVAEFVEGLDVLVEECDEIDMKLLVREEARRQRVPVVMETSDRGLLDVERFDQEPDRPVLHGLLDDMSAATMARLSPLDKVPYVLRLVDPGQASARGVASLAEIGRSLSTWPQLGGDVTLGGATIAATVRQIGLGEPVPSGRTRIDLESIVSSLECPAPGSTDRSRARAGRSTLHDDEPPTRGAASHRSAFPPAGTVSAPVPADPVLAIVHAATMAPSCGNNQPWRFELTARELAIELHRSKSCATVDVRSRASYIGLGAALFNARVAAAAANRLGAVRLFPEGPSSDVAATLELASGSDDELADLYDAMLVRCSNRRHGTPAELDLTVVARLDRAASAEGAKLHLVTDRQCLSECAGILASAERIRFLTPKLREETVRELRWPGEDARAGIDVATLELSASEQGALELMRRGDVMELLEHWDAGGGLGDYMRAAVTSCSAIAVVTVEDATPASYVTGGMALERVWIEAQRSGLAVHAFAPAFIYAVQRSDFDALGGSRWSEPLLELSEGFRSLVGPRTRAVPTLVLRLSHAPPPSARSARLPLETVLRRRGAPAFAPAEVPPAELGERVHTA